MLKDRFQGLGLSFETFGMGLSRSNAPVRKPAMMYWNTLRSLKDSDLSSSLVLIYDMGEATGSTITGVVHELKSYGIPPDNVIFLLGAACVDQTRKRLESVAQNTSLVIGSKWKYDERPGPTQFYLTHIYDKGWIQQPPRDWGRCVSGMKNQATVKSFIRWVGETIKLSQGDEEKLFQVWSRKINEKKISH